MIICGASGSAVETVDYKSDKIANSMFITQSIKGQLPML